MKHLTVNPEQPRRATLRKVAESLRRSGIIAHPTETVYGLAAVWDDGMAIRRLSEIKQRSLQQPFSIMVASLENIYQLIGWKTPELQRLLRAIFPGPLTLLLANRAKHKLAYWNNFREIGIRYPDHRLSQTLINLSGSPLITTSANISGEPPPIGSEEISPQVLKYIDYLIDGGACAMQQPSTIIRLDWDHRNFTVIRQGTFDVATFQKLLQEIGS